MPVEKDDEATTFDPKPWGAMQRLLPNARFAVLRTSGPLQASSVAVIEPLVRAPARRRPPIRRPQAAMTMAIPTASPPPPMAVSHAPAMMTMAMAPAPMMSVSHAAPMMTMALPMSSLPMSPFSAEVDSTLRVRRRALTSRSLLAAPIGALFAAIVIVIAMAGSSKSGSAPAASVRMRTIEQPALPVLAPPPAPAAEPAAAAVPEAPEIEEVELDEDFVILEDEPASPSTAEPTTAEPTKRKTKRIRRGKPRKIVAVDASTPLGNLRPRRF